MRVVDQMSCPSSHRLSSHSETQVSQDSIESVTLTTMPKVCVYICELQIEHYKNTSQGKVSLVLPELAFVVCIAVTEGRGCPILALFHKT